MQLAFLNQIYTSHAIYSSIQNLSIIVCSIANISISSTDFSIPIVTDFLLKICYAK